MGIEPFFVERVKAFELSKLVSLLHVRKKNNLTYAYVNKILCLDHIK